MDSVNRWYKIGIGLVELFFGIPILGGAIILAHAWSPLIILFILHIAGVILSSNAHRTKSGHILGIIGNIIGFIPVVGMIFHFLTGITLVIQGVLKK